MVRFLADAMLGRLARYLRFLGYDVLYLRDIEDREVVRIARKEERILLTRDTELVKTFRIPNILINSDHVEQQVIQVVSRYPLSGTRSRCLRCNSELQDVADPCTVRDVVPEHVYHSARSFLRCPGCGSIYWEGSHYSRMRERLENILGGSNQR